jgi:putative ATPase
VWLCFASDSRSTMISSEQETAGGRREPLAFRMMPETLADFVGQRHVLAEGKMLWRMITADRLSSIILFGPPGTGKTSLAHVIANTTRTGYRQLNAVTSGVADIKRVIADTENPLLTPSGRTLLFIDEIHRFNKAQQDALLPSVESGRLILIGATTENPFFQVNKSLISRSTVFQLHPLSEEEVLEVMNRALRDKDRGLGRLAVKADQAALEMIARLSGGDARIALNGLELAALTTPVDENGSIVLTRETILDSMQKKISRFDPDGEEHYDTVSAMIKSMRGSDPDAAVFYLARALAGGEDISFIGRRITICAAEDVGLANPQMLSIAHDAWQAALMTGMPEARIVLAEAVIAVATSPKSNRACLAIDKALADIEEGRPVSIPFHLRNAPVKKMKDLGYGQGYLYDHDFPQSISGQSFLPEELAGTVYYEPSENGYESKIAEWMDRVKEIRRSRHEKSEEMR